MNAKYKYGDLVWRNGVGFGIIVEAKEANITDEEILEAFPGDRYIYSILWDCKDVVVEGFREGEIDDMKESMYFAQIR